MEGGKLSAEALQGLALSDFIAIAAKNSDGWNLDGMQVLKQL